MTSLLLLADSITGTSFVGALWTRLSKFTLINTTTGERRRTHVKKAYVDPDHRVTATPTMLRRVTETCQEMSNLLGQTSVDSGDYVRSSSTGPKLVDPFPLRENAILEEDEVVRESPMGTYLFNPKRTDVDGIPLGEQIVRVPTELVATAQLHSAFRERTTNLFQSVYQRVVRHATKMQISEDEKQYYCKVATTLGFTPNACEIACIQHMDGPDFRQKVLMVNDFVLGANIDPHFSNQKYKWWDVSSWHVFDNSGNTPIMRSVK
jgi:hypothetical protein